MTEQQHSPEPWRKHGVLRHVLDSDGNGIAISCCSLEDIERILACINACQYISNEDLEAGVVATQNSLPDVQPVLDKMIDDFDEDGAVHDFLLTGFICAVRKIKDRFILIPKS